MNDGGFALPRLLPSVEAGCALVVTSAGDKLPPFLLLRPRSRCVCGIYRAVGLESTRSHSTETVKLPCRPLTR